MKAFILALLLIVSAYAIDEKGYQHAFLRFMHQHKKSYSNEEFQTRYNVFKANYDFVQNFKNADFKVALNKFADLSNVEFAAMYNGLRVPKDYVHNQTYFPTSNVALPTEKDWRKEGAVTAIKDQGQCGSCWSFSTTGSVEGCHFLGTKKLVALSEKNLMDCSWTEGNQGCNGGLMTQAMEYIIKNHGIDSEESYPYQPVSSHDCRYKTASKSSTLSSYTNVKSGSESDLQNAVNDAPTSVAIDASQSSFQFYHSGVYYDASCSSSQLDHGVLAVGWGVENSKDYWIVKNSWGESWGLKGYILMSRNRNNNCGIATMATRPSSCGN